MADIPVQSSVYLTCTRWIDNLHGLLGTEKLRDVKFISETELLEGKKQRREWGERKK